MTRDEPVDPALLHAPEPLGRIAPGLFFSTRSKLAHDNEADRIFCLHVCTSEMRQCVRTSTCSLIRNDMVRSPWRNEYTLSVIADLPTATDEIDRTIHVDAYHSDARPSAVDLPAIALESRSAGQRSSVLVVDDEATVRLLITEVLDDLNYASLEAVDGPSGLRILQSDTPIDLMITDVGLPGGMSGRHLASAGPGRATRARHPLHHRLCRDCRGRRWRARSPHDGSYQTIFPSMP